MVMAMDMEAYASGPSGTGTRIGRAAVIVAGVAGLVATLTTSVSIWLQSYDCASRYLDIPSSLFTNIWTARIIESLSYNDT
jgi:hypothetical protein